MFGRKKSSADHVNEFAKWVEAHEGDGLFIYDVSTLPCSKAILVEAFRNDIVAGRDSREVASAALYLSFLSLFQEGVGSEPLKVELPKEFGKSDVTRHEMDERLRRVELAIERKSSSKRSIDAAMRGEDPLKHGVPLIEEIIVFNTICDCIINIPNELQNRVIEDIESYEKIISNLSAQR